MVLELGGKSPTVVGKDANLKLAARRLVFAKGTNAGQTCVAPDYVLVHSEIKQALIQAFKNEVVAFYGKEPLESQDYGKLINDKNYNRVKKYLGDGKILFGEETDDGLHKIGLTLLEIEDMDVPVMTEEIFGRVLPLITFETFTHKKSVFKGSTLVDLKVKYPPYNKKKIALIKKLMY